MAHTPFTGSLPDDRLYCLRHDMCVQACEDGTVVIGAAAYRARIRKLEPEAVFV